MKYETLVLGPYRTNCYLLWNEEGDALLVDPGDEAARIEQAVESRGLCVRGFLITHGHPDHIGALAALQAFYSAPIWMHEADQKAGFSTDFLSDDAYAPPRRPPCGFAPLSDGQTILASPFAVKVLFLPGHSAGSLGYYLPEEALVFTGDTLFRGMVGNTALAGADSAALRVSLRCLQNLPSETLVLPGHGSSTTIGRERQANFAITSDERAEARSFV